MHVQKAKRGSRKIGRQERKYCKTQYKLRNQRKVNKIKKILQSNGPEAAAQYARGQDVGNFAPKVGWTVSTRARKRVNCNGLVYSRRSKRYVMPKAAPVAQ